MKNELLEQLKEIIEPKVTKSNLEVITDEELYDKIFEEIIYYSKQLETEKETISITIKESAVNERICEVSCELDKEKTNTKNGCSYITASGLAIKTIDSIKEMFIYNGDISFFKHYAFEDGCINLILDYPSIAAGLKVRDIFKKIKEKRKEVSE